MTFSHDEAEGLGQYSAGACLHHGGEQHKGRSVAPGMGLREGASLRRAHAYKMRAASSFPNKGFTRSFCSIQFALLIARAENQHRRVEERRLVEGIILRTSTANGTKITTDGSGLTFEALPSHPSSPA